MTNFILPWDMLESIKDFRGFSFFNFDKQHNLEREFPELTVK
jgi:hypothetical protein